MQTNQPSYRVPTVRLAALDGLRGVAALIVLFHHSMLLNPAFPGSPGDASGTMNPVISWLSFTPLKLATAGQEAVIVFFVLSGLVVTLPVVKRSGFDWMAYFPRRIVRLGVPVVVSVLVAAVFVFLIPQNSPQSLGTWLSRSSTPSLSWEMIVRGWDLVGGNGQINNPLWSLRWEVLFSLALPVFVVLALAFRKWWIAGLAVAVLLAWLGVRAGSGALSYFPAFFVGAVVAVKLEALRAWIDRMNASRWRHVMWPAFTLASAGLIIMPWLLRPLSAGSTEITAVAKSLAPLAAAGLVIAALGWRGLVLTLSSKPFQFLGWVSFSLYLVHVPILIFSYYLFPGQALIVPILFGIALAFAVAIAFAWLVEQRSQGWARAVGERASSLFSWLLGANRRAADDDGAAKDLHAAATLAQRSPAS